MKALIISASKFETQFLSSKIKVFSLNELKINTEKTCVLISGAGVIETSFAVNEAINYFKPYIIINMGIAGALNPNLKLETNCIVKSDFILDSGIFRHDTYTHLSECRFSENKTKILKPSFNISRLMPECIEVDAQTVNLFYNQENKLRPTPYQNTNADIETMEGAAVFYIANKKDIPVCSIRTISNYIGKNYNEENYQNAVKQNCHIIEKLIERLNAY